MKGTIQFEGGGGFSAYESREFSVPFTPTSNDTGTNNDDKYDDGR